MLLLLLVDGLQLLDGIEGVGRVDAWVPICVLRGMTQLPKVSLAMASPPRGVEREAVAAPPPH